MNNIVLHAVAGAVAWIRTHVAAITWVSRPALNPPRYKSTPVARQTEFDPAPTTLFPLFYFPHTSCLVHLGPQSWFALAPDRDPPWPTILAPLDLLWVSTQKFQARKCSTISLQSTQALLTPNVAGAVTGIRTHVAAIAWVSHPALNPPRHKGTPAARQTESDPTPTTLFPRFCPFFADLRVPSEWKDVPCARHWTQASRWALQPLLAWFGDHHYSKCGDLCHW